VITGRKYSRHFTNKTSSERDIEIEIEISLLTKSGPQELYSESNHDYRVKMNVIDYITITYNLKNG
jgi:hypothetical protein